MTLWEARFSWIWLGNCACRLGSRGDNFKFFSASRRKIWNSLLLTPTYAHNFSQIHSNLASQSVISAKIKLRFPSDYHFRLSIDFFMMPQYSFNKPCYAIFHFLGHSVCILNDRDNSIKLGLLETVMRHSLCGYRCHKNRVPTGRHQEVSSSGFKTLKPK